MGEPIFGGWGQQGKPPAPALGAPKVEGAKSPWGPKGEAQKAGPQVLERVSG